jgi:deoxyribonuclease V
VLAAAAPAPRPPEIEAALELAAERERWSRAGEVFAQVRGGLARAEDRLTEAERLSFRIAELIAKVAHNVAGPPPFYDHDAGWRIGPLAVRLAAAAPDPAVRERVAAALGEWPPREEPGHA